MLPKQQCIWKIELLSGITLNEDYSSPLGDGGWSYATKNPSNIKTLSLLTPNGEYIINLQTGQIMGENIYAELDGQSTELTNRNITYLPYQCKEGFFISETGQQGIAGYRIGWQSPELKIRAYLRIDGLNYKPSFFVEEVV